MFVDTAKIYIKAGDGGDGAVSFHREKYVAAGGPDGGRGGNVVFVADTNLSTLADFRYKRKYLAKKGENGRGGRCRGKNAEDLIIRVPLGTLVKEEETGRVLADVSSSEPYIVARGGERGGGVIRILLLLFVRSLVLQNPVYPEKSLMLLLNLNFWRMSDL